MAHVVDRYVPYMILKEIASCAFYLVIFQSRLFCGKLKDIRRNNLSMGKFAKALVLICRDNRVLSNKNRSGLS